MKWPGIFVEDEVLKILGVEQVGPEDINWEFIMSELPVSLHHQVSAVLLVFAIMETQTVD